MAEFFALIFLLGPASEAAEVDPNPLELVYKVGCTKAGYEWRSESKLGGNWKPGDPGYKYGPGCYGGQIGIPN